jgi:hypothetical protein
MLSDFTSTDTHSGHDISGLLRNLDPVDDFALVWAAGAFLGGLIGLALWLTA